jgi:hypothetical protein
MVIGKDLASPPFVNGRVYAGPLQMVVIGKNLVSPP